MRWYCSYQSDNVWKPCRYSKWCFAVENLIMDNLGDMAKQRFTSDLDEFLPPDMAKDAGLVVGVRGQPLQITGGGFTRSSIFAH